MQNLDAIIAATPAGGRINLQRYGSYWTTGYRETEFPNHANGLKPGVQLYGNGSTVRVLPPSSSGNFSGLLGFSSNIITGLTLDIASSAQAAGRKVNGIWVDGGSNSMVANCTVLGQCSDVAAQRESFGIRVGGRGIGGQNTIRGCVVSSPHGDYNTGIQGQGAVIEFCTVHYPEPITSPGQWFCYNIGYLSGTTIRECKSYGGTNAVRCEAWGPSIFSSRSMVRNCQFHRCLIGFYALAQQHAGFNENWGISDISFDSNLVRLSNTAVSQPHGVIIDHTWTVFSNDPTTLNSIQRIRVNNNDFDFDTPNPTKTNVWFVNIASNTPGQLVSDTLGIRGVQILGNKVNPALLWRNKGMNAQQVEVDQIVTWVTT